MSPNERLVCVLGNSYVQNFLASGGGAVLTKGFSVVSDKRVYFRGTTYWIEGKKIRKMRESKTVDLEDVTGTSVTLHKNIWLKITAIIALVLSVLFPFLLLPLLPSMLLALILWAVIFIGGGVSFFAFYLTSKKVLKLEYAGGGIGFNIKWFSVEERKIYQKQLRLARDKVINELLASGNIKICGMCSTVLKNEACPKCTARPSTANMGGGHYSRWFVQVASLLMAVGCVIGYFVVNDMITDKEAVLQLLMPGAVLSEIFGGSHVSQAVQELAEEIKMLRNIRIATAAGAVFFGVLSIATFVRGKAKK
jgi:hypothetical protein